MREGWEYKKLAEMISITHGYAFKGEDFETDFEGNNPIVLTPGNFSEESKLYFNPKNTKRCHGDYSINDLFKINELVVVMTDLSSKMKILGKPAIIDSVNILHNQRIGRVIFKNEGLELRYLFHFFNSDNYLKSVKETATGTMVRHTSPQRILLNEIPIPPLEEQKQIVSILDQAFEAIDQAKANIEKNIANAKELFQSKLNAIFSQKGEGWEEKSLGEVCDETKNIKWQDYPSQEFEYVDLGSVSRETLSIIETITVNSKNAPSRAKKIIKLGDVIFATTRPTLRRATIIKEELAGHICSTGFVVLRPKRNISSDWIFLYLLTTTFMERMETLQRGASYPAVSDNDVKGSKLSVPTSEIVEKEIILKMRKFQQEIDEIILQYKQKLNNLEDLKKSILQKAFAGALTNKEAIV